MSKQEQESEVAYYRRVAEDLRNHYDGLVGRLAEAELTTSMQNTQITKLKNQIATYKKHLNHLRMENEALRSMVPGDCELDLVPQDTDAEPTAEPVAEHPPLEPLDLDPYLELKVPHFDS